MIHTGMTRIGKSALGIGALALVIIGAIASDGFANGIPITSVPKVSNVKLTPSTFKAALTPTPGFGATVHYMLSENAVQTFVVKKKQGSKWVTMKGTFVKRGRQGKDVFPFPGILHGHKLLAGHYEMVVTPALTGVGTGKPVSAKFTVIS
jgi:hypothetical protein